MVDIQYFFNAILARVDPASAGLVILIIAGLRYAIPGPDGKMGAFAVPEWINRFVLPFLPYPLGIACFMLLRDHSVAMPFHDIAIKGLFSGGLADLAYRKFRVVLLGS